MNKSYEIQITNGTGTVSPLNGTYNVTTNVTGYNNESITPKSVTINDTTTSLEFKVAAEGVLTVHVTEDGNESGTPIVGATFNRCNQDGTVIYGDTFTSDSSGNVTFSNVAFDTTSGINLYFKQLTSDGNHNFSTEVVTVNMNSSTVIKQIANPLPTPISVTYIDTNYSNLSIPAGTITITN